MLPISTLKLKSYTLLNRLMKPIKMALTPVIEKRTDDRWGKEKNHITKPQNEPIKYVSTTVSTYFETNKEVKVSMSKEEAK